MCLLTDAGQAIISCTVGNWDSWKKAFEKVSWKVNPVDIVTFYPKQLKIRCVYR